MDEEAKLLPILEGILEARTKLFHLRSVNKYLIKWKNVPEDEAT